ncbi:MAG TPA: lipo-like protein [Burkholderiales bacterium]|nr:lipo-like protein [Burkholderiales bacterium]
MNRIGLLLARFLEKPLSQPPPFDAVDPATLQACLRPGDVLLVEGTSRISLAIKYLTQSTWSHAALYVGDALMKRRPGAPAGALIEADLQRGVIAVPLGKYATDNTRICRPVGLTPEDCRAVVDYMIGSLGKRYDMRNVIDLMRYLLPQPPVPLRWRRRMLALGSGDPTRAICSTLIAQAFQAVRYPILPLVSSVFVEGSAKGETLIGEMRHIRHHSLFTPRDFDVSPYFQIVKPTIERKFDYRTMRWAGPLDERTGAAE